ncbi:MAG: hypothetical protein ACFFDN_29535 [Candidatus Hodarchaeota archaeon]
MAWGPEDSLGIVSIILGTIWTGMVQLIRALVLGPGTPQIHKQIMAFWLLLIGGGAILTMGIIAVANDSKIGIGGIVFGAAYILSALIVYRFAL